MVSRRDPRRGRRVSPAFSSTAFLAVFELFAVLALKWEGRNVPPLSGGAAETDQHAGIDLKRPRRIDRAGGMSRIALASNVTRSSSSAMMSQWTTRC